MKDADEALSRIARASTDTVGGIDQNTTCHEQEPEVNPTVAFEVAEFTKGDVVTPVEGEASLERCGVASGTSYSNGVTCIA